LFVEYQPSEDTEDIIYDQDVEILMNWEVTKVFIKRWLSTVNPTNETDSV